MTTSGMFGSLKCWRGDPLVFDCTNRVSHSGDGILSSRICPQVQELTVVSQEIDHDFIESSSDFGKA
jgi:hypothetical protein